MDSNLMSCPTCGHSVSNIAGACTYCGAVTVDQNQPAQTQGKEVVEKAQATELPPPLPQEETPPADGMADMADQLSTADTETEPSDPDGSQQPVDLPAVAEKSESATEAVIDSADEAVAVEDEVIGKPSDGEPDLETQPERGPLTPDAEGESESAFTQAVGPESFTDVEAEPAAEVNLDTQEPEIETAPAVDDSTPIALKEVQTESAADEVPSPPEPEVVDLAGDEPGESETLGENIAELIEIESSQQEPKTQASPEMSSPPEKSVEAAETDPVQGLQPNDETDINPDVEPGLIPETSGETILLDLADEVQPAARELPDKTEETVKPESPTRALKIEKDAQDMAAAIEKQKAKMSEVKKTKEPKETEKKVQALKAQKAALVKARARKKQQLILAKKAALKRKKAALAAAQTQALKKQKADQAGIEATKKTAVAASNINTAADTAGSQPKIARDMAANNKMQILLEKYKGQEIGINYDNSADIKAAQIVEANGEFISVFVKDKKLKYSYPLNTILTVIEGEDGVDVGNSKQPNKFTAVIKVYPLVLF
jgi:hypothetical protein